MPQGRFAQGGGGAVGGHRPIPILQKSQRGFFGIGLRAGFVRNRLRDLQIDVTVPTGLQGGKILAGDVLRIADGLADERDAVGRLEIMREEMRIIFARRAVVGGGEEIAAGIEGRGEFIERDETRPLVCPVHARNGLQTLDIVARPNRDRARHLKANIAIHIGIDEVHARQLPESGGGAEFVPVCGLVELDNSLRERATFIQASPAQGEA